MKKFFTIYSLTRCPWCQKAKELLEERKLPFVVVTMDHNMEFVDEILKLTKRDDVPVVLEQTDLQEHVILGNYIDLENYLNSPDFKAE